MNNKELQLDLIKEFIKPPFQGTTTWDAFDILISTIEEQAKEIERLKEEKASAERTLFRVGQEKQELRNQLKEAVEALEFYADVSTYDIDHLNKYGYIIIDKDGGEKARIALSNIQGKGITWSHDCPNVDDNYGLQVVESGKECPFCGKSEIGKETTE